MSINQVRQPARSWARAEFKDAEFGDRRLKNRLIQLADRIVESPESPINQACHDWAETKAAYRFFKNDRVEAADILLPHIQKTVKRAQQQPFILAIQDTSYLCYTTHEKTAGLGTLFNNKWDERGELRSVGLLMHTSFAVTTEGLPLGILDQKIFVRNTSQKKLKKRSNNLQTPIGEKESHRWVEALRKTEQAMRSSGTRVVTVGDRESDIYDVFVAAFRTRSSVLIRAGADRAINRHSRFSDKRDHLWKWMSRQPSQGKIQIEIPSRSGRPQRIATLELRYGAIQIAPPDSYVMRQGLPALEIYAVHVIEKWPPKGEKPLEWMLLTDLTIHNFDEAVEKVRWYSLRWRIEIFHKILKSGLRVEECRLEAADRLIRYLSLMSVVAWRIYWINLIGRTDPDRPCTDLLSEQEWKVLYSKINQTHRRPKRPITIYEAIRWIARLGGFLARKGDGEPGVLSIWRGWKRLSDLSEGWMLARTQTNCG